MGLLQWLARRIAAELPQPAPAPRGISLESALETFLVKRVEAETRSDLDRAEARRKGLAEEVGLLSKLADYEARAIQKAFGRQGGIESGKRRRAKAAAADPTWCPVCKHDNARCTKPLIRWHMQGHQGPRPPMVAGQEVPRDEPRAAESNPESERGEALVVRSAPEADPRKTGALG